MATAYDGVKARPIGRTLRLIVGIALVVEGGRHLVGSSINLVLMTTAVIVAEVLFYAGLHVFILRFVPRLNRWFGALLAVTPVALVYVLSDAPGKLGSVLFVGISLLFTAMRSDGGCEVMTIPGILFGRRTHLVCIAFSPIDWIEAKVTGKSTK